LNLICMQVKALSISILFLQFLLGTNQYPEHKIISLAVALLDLQNLPYIPRTFFGTSGSEVKDFWHGQSSFEVNFTRSLRRTPQATNQVT
jgi:hypothetical protein